MQTPRDISYTGNPTGGTTAYPAVLPAAHEATENSGNSELILDRKVSDKRTFPAIDISRSGTRKEELITDPQLLKKMYVLRRILNPMGTMDAIDFLLDKLRNTKNNSEFFDSMNT